MKASITASGSTFHRNQARAPHGPEPDVRHSRRGRRGRPRGLRGCGDHRLRLRRDGGGGWCDVAVTRPSRPGTTAGAATRRAGGSPRTPGPRRPGRRPAALPAAAARPRGWRRPTGCAAGSSPPAGSCPEHARAGQPARPRMRHRRMQRIPAAAARAGDGAVSVDGEAPAVAVPAGVGFIVDFVGCWAGIFCHITSKEGLIYVGTGQGGCLSQKIGNIFIGELLTGFCPILQSSFHVQCMA